MAIVPNEGLDRMAQRKLGKLAGTAAYTARLSTVDVAEGNTHVFGDFVECTLAGYAAIALTGSSWTGSTVAGVSTYTYPTLTFTFLAYAGGTTIYDIYFEDTTAPSKLGWYMRLATPYAVPALGGSLSFAPSFEDDNS